MNLVFLLLTFLLYMNKRLYKEMSDIYFIHCLFIYTNNLVKKSFSTGSNI